MEITEVRIKLMDEPGERLKAFCSITFDDCFVVRDLKIIEGTSGPFVAMPSRKLTTHCTQCRAKNHLRATYCNQCGNHLRETHIAKDDEGRAKLYADIAHPINSTCREIIQARVIEAFQQEMVWAEEPGYTSRYDDFDEIAAATETVATTQQPQPTPPPRMVEPPPTVETPPVEDSPVEPSEEPISRIDKTKIDESETPRGPHTAPGVRRDRGAGRPRKGSFGDGIFE